MQIFQMKKGKQDYIHASPIIIVTFDVLPDRVELAVFYVVYTGDDIVALDWEDNVGHASCAVCAE